MGRSRAPLSLLLLAPALLLICASILAQMAYAQPPQDAGIQAGNGAASDPAGRAHKLPALAILDKQRDRPLDVEPAIEVALAVNGTARVIVRLKSLDALSKEELRELRKLARDDKALRQLIREKAVGGVTSVKHRYQFDGFSASVTPAELAALRANPLVERIEHDEPVTLFLQDSVALINATDAWSLQATNLTGRGRTVCVLDTGIDYTHPELGGCTPDDALTRTVEPYSLASPNHPAGYAANLDIITTVTRPGYDRIAVHFTDIDLEQDYDYVCILDNNDSFIACYTGLMGGFWSPSVEGDTLKVLLSTDDTDEGGPYRGFRINATKNATTASTMDWSSCSKVLGGHDFVNSDSDPMDDDGHGTHVAGIIAANSTLRGVAPDASLIAVKVLDAQGSGFRSDVVAGIEYCTSIAQQYNISAISMSLGSGAYSASCDAERPTYADAINAAVAKNISVVVATGNDGHATQISAPSCISAATAVGATTKQDTIAGYSNRNALVQLVAPGSEITSARNGGGLITLGGTSMAAPHVSGAIALLDQYLGIRGARKTPAQIATSLNMTGARIIDGATGISYSRIDVSAAILSFDERKPMIVVASPSGASSNASVLIDLIANGTGSEIFQLLVSINGSEYSYARATYNGSALGDSALNCSVVAQDVLSCSRIASLPDGNHSLSVYARDLAGNTNTSTSVVIIDTTGPVIIAATPIPAIVRTGSSVLVSLNVTERNIAYVRANGQDLTCAVSNQSSVWICSGNITVTASTILFTVGDVAGNGASANASVTIDDLPPQITALPAGNSSSAVISFNITDDNGIDNGSIAVMGVGGFHPGACVGNLSSLRCSFSANLTQGDNSIFVQVRDVAGNNASATSVLRLDSLGPLIIANTTPTSRAAPATQIIIQYAINDSSALSRAWYTLDGAASDLNTTQGTISLSGLSAGAHRIILHANDTLGNEQSNDLGPVYVLAPVNITRLVADMRRGAVADTAVYLGGSRLSDGTAYLNSTVQQELLADPSQTGGVDIRINLTIFGNNLDVAQAAVPSLDTNATGPAGSAISARLGAGFSALALLHNMSAYVQTYDDAQGIAQWQLVRFARALGDDAVVYVDNNDSIHRLAQCAGNSAPAPPASRPGCYVDAVDAVEVYLAGFSGAGLADAGSAPLYDISSPAGSLSESKLVLDGTVRDLDLDVTSCRYNLSKAGAPIIVDMYLAPALAHGTTDYSFGMTPADSAWHWNLSDGEYGLSITCASLDGNRSSATVSFSVNDSTAPNITAGATPSATSATIVLAADYDEFNYSLSANGATFTGLFARSHSLRLEGLASDAAYSFTVDACDRKGNCASSGPYLFTTSSPSTSGASSGGGGGGGGGGGANTILTLTTKPVNKTLSARGTLTFSLRGDPATYDLAVKSIADVATIDVQSQTVVLGSGDSSHVDLDADGIDDIVVTLLALTNRSVTLSLRAQSAPVPSIDASVATASDDVVPPPEQRAGSVAGDMLGSTAPLQEQSSSIADAQLGTVVDSTAGARSSSWIYVSITILGILALLGMLAWRHRDDIARRMR